MQKGQLKTIEQEFWVKIYKRGGWNPHFNKFKSTKKQMSYQTTNYLTTPTSPNPYVTRKLNNMKEAKMMKDKRNNWTKTYHKTLKGLEAMINV